jgi:hypothetical protein
MIFTYLAEEKLIILSSRADTTKVRHMENNQEVALLLYRLQGSGKSAVSCTLHGKATVLQPGKDTYYREIHHKNHKDLSIFITGDNVSIITVNIKHATLSDLEDRVYNWTAENSVKQNPSADKNHSPL